MYVYIITNNINGKKYIGLSINKKPSFRESYFGSGMLIKQAIQKYGKENFSKEIIKDFDNEDEARQFEKELIEFNDAVKSDMFYNLAGGGYGGAGTGRVLSEETKEKISKSLFGRKRPDIGEKVRNKLLGRKQSESVIAKRSLGLKNAWSKMSKKEKLDRGSKISNALKGKKTKQETKDKLSIINGKLTKEEVMEMFDMANDGVTYREIGEKYDLSMSCISEIINKKTYQWVWNS